MSSYSALSQPISAFDLSSCLATGFKTAAENLADMTRSPDAPIRRNQFNCEQSGVRIAVRNDPRQQVKPLSYLDLASVMFLIQRFQAVYLLPNVRFDVDYTVDGVNYQRIGQGLVTEELYGVGGDNGTAEA